MPHRHQQAPAAGNDAVKIRRHVITQFGVVKADIVVEQFAISGENQIRRQRNRTAHGQHA